MNIKIENEKFEAVISTFGAEIQSLKRKNDGSEYIWSGDESVWKNHAPILFPFVARCFGGYFVIEGEKREYTRNHGFARDLETKVIEQTKNKVTFELTDCDQTINRFPYKFSLATTYELTDEGLNWDIKVSNKDTKVFKFSVGTHTAFACPRNTEKDSSFTDYVVEFEKKEPLVAALCTPEGFMLTNDDGSLPVTKPYGEKETGFVPLVENGFGNGHLFTNFNSDWVGLRNKKTNSLVSINTKGFPYCMLWQNTSGAPQFVCIEPWHGIPDTTQTDHIWDTKPGLIALNPETSFISSQNIRIS